MFHGILHRIYIKNLISLFPHPPEILLYLMRDSFSPSVDKNHIPPDFMFWLIGENKTSWNKKVD